MKIGQYLAEIWTRVLCLPFLTQGVYGPDCRHGWVYSMNKLKTHRLLPGLV